MNLHTYLNYCTHFNKLLSRNYCNLGKLGPLNCLACKFFTIVCSSSDLFVRVSSLCVWRCGHLLVLLLSKEKVHWDSLYKLLAVPACHVFVLVVLARSREALKSSALVDSRWSPAQISDLVEKCRLARNTLHDHLVSEPWPLIQIRRQKSGFHRGWS